MNIKLRLTILAILLSGASFVILSVIEKYEPAGLRFGYELLVPILLFSGMIMYSYTEKLMRRIDRISSRIDMILNGKFQLEISPLRQDEIGKVEEGIAKIAYNNEALTKSQKKEAHTIQTILSGIQEGVIILDPLGRVILINSAVELMFERSQRTLVGKPLMHLMRNDHLDEFVTKILNGKNQGNIELEVRKKIYTIWVSVMMDDSTNMGAVLVIRDITELRRLERMRTEFVANVSHELRTPLTSIKGFVETLLSGAAEDRDVRERFLNIIQSESLRLQSIIEDLLTLSRIESKQLGQKGESLKFGFIQNAYEKIRPVLEPYAQAKGLSIKADIPENLPCIQMGEDLLSQVLLNLMENAVKYTTKGQVALSCTVEGNWVVTVISDSGCGIPPESLSRIFERFYRVDKARSREMGGTGLGLSIVKHIVEGSGGKIEVESQVGKGTSFKCYLPMNIIQHHGGTE